MTELDVVLVFAQQTMPEINLMYWVMLLSRILHILAAIILVGGIFYLRTIVTPSIATPNANVDEQFGGRRAAWAMWVGIATLLLLVTGLWNYMQIIKTQERMALFVPHGRRAKNAGWYCAVFARRARGRTIARCGNDAAKDAVLAECVPAGRNCHRGSRQRAADLPAQS